MADVAGDVVGTIILAVLIVQAVRYCAARAQEAAEVIRDGVGGDIPPLPREVQDWHNQAVQQLRDRGAL